MTKIYIKEITDKDARAMSTCLGCGAPKDNSHAGAPLVCWDCWRHPVLPFKYHEGTIDEWATQIVILNAKKI